MNREIKFRGYSKNINKWVFGDLINTPEKGHRIIWFEYKGESQFDLDYDPFNEVVETKSIGQYTGLTDKNGLEIYEGDVVDIPYNHIGRKVATFYNGCYNIVNYDLNKIEVIGNIYENPELLK